MLDVFKDKNILITGGTGSIGSEIFKQLLQYQPKTIRIFSNDERAQFELQSEFGYENKSESITKYFTKFRINNTAIRFLIGDVRDLKRLTKAMEDIDIVFHAAALKHVPSSEFNPFEAVHTNVIGTQNIIDAALTNNVGKVVNISTDKVVNPLNTMGATKLLAEKLIASAEFHKGPRKTAFSSVRFGNVIGSSGSVLPLFRKQILNQQQLTITEPEMSRFILTIPQAVKLVLSTVRDMSGGEIFILKMPSIKIINLAKAVTEEMCEKHNIDIKDIKFITIGARPGEKMHEELMTAQEAEYTIETEDKFILKPLANKQINNKLDVYASDNNRFLSIEEIKNLISTIE
jgi:UDP-N-acetylglucosamine 4,6-dehydratase/5-epimerase